MWFCSKNINLLYCLRWLQTDSFAICILWLYEIYSAIIYIAALLIKKTKAYEWMKNFHGILLFQSHTQSIELSSGVIYILTFHSALSSRIA